MAFKISKAELKRAADYSQKLCEARVEIDTIIEAINSRREDDIADLNQRFERYNELLGEACGFVEDIHSEQESAFEDKSDNWKEGDRGEATQEWIAKLEELKDETLATGFDPIDEEPLEISEVPDHSEALEGIEQEPSY